MAATRKKTGFRVAGFEFKVGDVSAKTKVSQLTVGDLLELMIQVNEQASLRRKAPDAATLRTMFEEVEKTIVEQKSDSDLARMVERTRVAIAARIPASTGAPPGNGGISKHPRAVSARAKT